MSESLNKRFKPIEDFKRAASDRLRVLEDRLDALSELPNVERIQQEIQADMEQLQAQVKAELNEIRTVIATRNEEADRLGQYLAHIAVHTRALHAAAKQLAPFYCTEQDTAPRHANAGSPPDREEPAHAGE